MCAGPGPGEAAALGLGLNPLEKVKSVPSVSLPTAKKRKSDKVRGAGKGGGRGGTQDTPNTPLSLQNPNSPRRSKSLKHKNGEGAGLAPLGGAGKRGGASLGGGA